MTAETTVGAIALAWLVGSVLAMLRSIRAGRDLAAILERQHPEVYEALGRPRPGVFASGSRLRFAQFVGKRRYQELADKTLAAQFDAYRRAEARLVVIILITGGIMVLLGLAVTRAG